MAGRKRCPKTIERRKVWMAKYPERQEKTCNCCGKTVKIYDPEESDDGFSVHKGKGELPNYVPSLCILCVKSRKKQKADLKTPEAMKEVSIKKLVAASWACPACNDINKGSRTKCRSCEEKRPC